MRTIASLAATAILICLPLGAALAQNASDRNAPTSPPETAAPAAPAAAPAVQTPQADAPAQSANPPSSNPPATITDNTAKNTPKTRKKTAGMTRRQEIQKSIDSGTVPSRYRSSVPKEYQHYIPFSKD
jgi:hypothetical protein